MKTVWITGGTRGIGLATAKYFSKEGYQVVISGKSPAMEYISAGLFDYEWLDYKNVHYYPCDITNASSVDFVTTNIRKQVGPIDIFINNAGIFSTNSLEEYSHSEMERLFATNTFGAINVSTLVAQEMLTKGRGIIINILSIAALKAFEGVGLYSASKAALASYAKSLREEVRSSGVHVVNIYPGATLTDIWPEKSKKEQGKQMMSAESVASAVFSAAENCQKDDMTVEEMVLRPIGGDL